MFPLLNLIYMYKQESYVLSYNDSYHKHFTKQSGVMLLSLDTEKTKKKKERKL